MGFPLGTPGAPNETCGKRFLIAKLGWLTGTCGKGYLTGTSGQLTGTCGKESLAGTSGRLTGMCGKGSLGSGLGNLFLGGMLKEGSPTGILDSLSALGRHGL